MTTLLSNLVSILYLLNFLIAFVVIFLERKNPTKTLTWIMVLFLLPGVGFFCYVMFSQNISRQKLFRLTTFEEANISNSLYHQMAAIKNKVFPFARPEAEKWADMIHLNQVYGSSYFTQDNNVEIFIDGNDKFRALFDDIRHAEHSIHVMYYILQPDELGLALIDLLAKKAREGVEVRLLLDAVGSRSINKEHYQPIIDAGGQVALFFPPKLKKINLKLNYRNHRKIVVIDSEVGYIGGFNVGEEYVSRDKKFGHWRDTHLRLVGGCVQDLDARFVLDWRFASKENLVMAHSFYPQIDTGRHSGVQIISSGPDSPQTEIRTAYLKMITSAKKSISIQTPYFIPDDSIFEALKMAALSGVDVRIMIPCMPDHMFVYWATYSYCGMLLNSGAKIYIYNDGFLHAKTITVDDEICSIGSSNLDIRSFTLNFEANALIYDSDVSREVRHIFEEDMENSTQLTKQIYRNRSLIIKFKESISRLGSELL